MKYADYIKSGKPGKIHVFDITELGFFTKSLTEQLKRKDTYIYAMQHGLDVKKLESVLNVIAIPRNIRKLCNRIGEISHITTNAICVTAREIQIEVDSRVCVENDKYFKYDVSYALTMALFICLNGRFPTPREFWKTWLKYNRRIYAINVSLINEETSLRRWCRARSDYSEKMQNEGRIDIKRRAEERCARAYCGIMRDYYVMACLAEMNYSVWFNPSVDVDLKMDVIVYSPAPNMGITALAVFLDSDRSRENCGRKISGIPKSLEHYIPTMLDVAVGLEKSEKESNRLILSSRKEIIDLGHMLQGDKELIKAYEDKNKVYFRSAYFGTKDYEYGKKESSEIM